VTFIERFVGSYDVLDGGVIESSALILSGGIHNTYNSDIIRYVTNNTKITDSWALNQVKYLQTTYEKLDSIVPNVEEFFFIMQCALKQNNLIGIATQCVFRFRLFNNLFFKKLI
jgi:hypothetical protein